MQTGGHESHTSSQQIVSILPWTELGEEQGLPYKEFLEPTAPELLDFSITQANPFFQCIRKYIGIKIQIQSQATFLILALHESLRTHHF